MHPFSAFKYLINNKKRSAVVIAAILLGVFLLYMVQMIIFSTNDLYGRISYEPDKYCSRVLAKGSLLESSFINEVKNLDSVEGVLPMISYSIPINLTVGGSTGVPLYVMKNDNIKILMDRMGLKLKAGHMPTIGEAGILMHENIMKSNNYKIGDFVGGDVDNNIMFSGQYPIVGVIQGRPVVSFAYLNFYYVDRYGIAILPKKGRLEELNKYLESLPPRDLLIKTYNIDKNDLDAAMDSFNLLTTVISMMVIIIVSICVGFLCYIYLYYRRYEFGMLWALGFTRQRVINRVFMEISIINALGFLVGLLLSLIIGKIINVLIFTPSGQPLTLINIDSMVKALCIPLFTTIFSVIPIWRLLKRLDPISIIEGVD